MTVRTTHPVDPKFIHGDPFGVIGPNRKTPHRGIDYAVKSGTKLVSIGDGKIVATYWSDIIGWVVEIEVDVMIRGKKAKRVFSYCHLLEDYSDKFKVGDPVECGQIIVKSGNSGSRTTGAHLHLMAGRKPRLSVNPVEDPLPLINASLVKVEATPTPRRTGK